MLALIVYPEEPNLEGKPMEEGRGAEGDGDTLHVDGRDRGADEFKSK